MLKKNMGYMESEPFRRIIRDVEKMLERGQQPKEDASAKVSEHTSVKASVKASESATA